jgi:citrate lyase subunit beta/citryl-CoA lyase
MLAKAIGLPADELVLDLEDSVPAAGKAEARSRVAALLATPPWRERAVAVRINAIGTPWWQDDIAAASASGHARLSLVLPKAESADDVRAVEDRVGQAGFGNIGIQALIETARGLMAVQQIAAASARLQALIIGYADLAASLGRPAGSAAPWLAEQHAILLAARVNGLQAIDGPYFQIDGGDGLRRQAEETAALGFDGKWAIHPSHLAVINEVFTPRPEEIERARSLIARLDEASSAGAGASAFRGEMIDEAMRSAALRTLARAGIETGNK